MFNEVRIAVFAGHGGFDPGAVSGGRKEKDYNLQVSNALARRLKLLGYTVIQDRTTDRDSFISDKCALANKSGVAAMCEIHLNAGGGTGTEAWFEHGNSKSKELAEKVAKSVAALGFRNRGAKSDATSRFGSFGVLRGTNAPGVVAELCFLDNKDDMARFNSEKMAGALAKTLMSFCPLTLKPAAPSVPSSSLTVGDSVTITGAYANSASAKSAVHTAAIGRNVVIGRVHTGSNYPFRLDSTGGTPIGFAKASSIRKLANAPAKPAAKTKNYTVVSGDSLWSIAQRQLGSGTRYNEIMTLNKLKSDVIKPGQILKIPV